MYPPSPETSAKPLACSKWLFCPPPQATEDIRNPVVLRKKFVFEPDAEVRGKGTAYESGARVPMVIRGPGIEPGTRSRVIVHAADLIACCLELAGITPTTTNKNHTTSPAVVAPDYVSLLPLQHQKQGRKLP